MLRSHHKAARQRRTAPKKVHPQSFFALMKCVLYALPLTALLGVLLLLAATALLLSTKDPDRYHTLIGLILLYVTSALGGMIATLFYGRRSPVLCGILEGVCLFLLLSVLSLVLNDQDTNAALSLLYRLLLLPAALAGALFGARKRKVPRHRHRKT